LRIDGYGGGVANPTEWANITVTNGLTGLLEPVTYETWWAKLLRRFKALQVIEGREQDLATLLERGFITDREEQILTTMVRERLDTPWMARTGRSHALQLNTAVRWTVFAMAHPEFSDTKLASLAGVSRPTFTAILERLRPVLIRIAGEVGKTAELTDANCSDSRSRHRYGLSLVDVLQPEAA
jgi:hypothetical protein